MILLAATQCLQGCHYHAAPLAGRLVGLAAVLLLIAAFSLGPALIFHIIDKRSDAE